MQVLTVTAAPRLPGDRDRRRVTWRRGRSATPSLAAVGLLLGAAACSPSESAAPAIVLPALPAVPPALADEASYRRDSGHFMQGVVTGNAWVVGLSLDGLAAFDRSTLQPRYFPMAACARVAVASSRIYCTHHRAELQILDFSAADLRVTAMKSLPVTGPVAGVNFGGASLEGLAPFGGALLVAARRAGLLRVELDGSGGRLLPLPPGIREAWDVAPLDDHRVLLAAGADGLAVLDLQPDPDHPSLTAQVPLPGLAVAVSARGTSAYVAALGGGGHLVDATDPTRPRRAGSLDGVGVVYDLRPVGDLVVASTGYHQIAARAALDRLEVVGVRESKSFALAVTAGEDGQAFYAAEFSLAEQLRLSPTDPAASGYRTGGFLRISPGASAPASGTSRVALPVGNIGTAALAVRAVYLVDNQSHVAARQLPGFVLGPGETRTVDVEVPAGDWFVWVDAPDNLGSQFGVRLRPTSGPAVGDRLPVPLTFQSVDSASHDVLAAFGGRVGVLIVGAASCPVAFLALHAARQDLAPYLADGRVAAFSLDPWDRADDGDLLGLDAGFPHLLSPLTSSDGHDHSVVMDTLGKEGFTGPPMPLVYVVGRDGTLRLARWGYEPAELRRVLDAALAE